MTERKVKQAIRAARSGKAHHWPTIAAILADEVERLRAEGVDEQGDEGSYLWERCYKCGHRLRFSADHCPQCGIKFDGRADPNKWPDKCPCDRCTNARAKGES